MDAMWVFMEPQFTIEVASSDLIFNICAAYWGKKKKKRI